MTDLPPARPIIREPRTVPQTDEEKQARRLAPVASAPINPKPERILIFDTEAALRWFWYDDKGTNRMMMWVAQWVDSSTPVGRIILPKIVLEDSRKRYVGLPVTDRVTALNDFREIYEQADLLIGHNVRNFDYATINGEMLLLGLPPLKSRPMHDTLRDMKKAAKQSRSLGNLLPRITDDTEKEHVHPMVWEQAFNDFDPAALREVWNRCVTDVMGHWELHKVLKSTGWLKPPRSS